MVMMPPAGMPAAPTLEAVAVTLQMLRDHRNTMSRKNLPMGLDEPCLLNSQDGEDLPAVQLSVIELSNKDSSDALE